MKLRAVHIVLLILLAAELALLIFGPQSRDHLPEIAKAAASGHKTDWWDDAAMGVRYAAWINAGLIGALLLTSKWWARGIATTENGNRKSEIGNPRWFWPALIAAAAFCLVLRLPLAGKSLWWDEAWVIMQASHGKWTPDKKHEGQLKFTAHDWKRCAWYYQKPTNHAPMSLLQKTSITAWQKLTGAKREEFSDLSARVPALVASCLAVVLLGLLLRTWGRPGAGIAAAFLLAIHPWYIRYGVDARAYALVVPLCISGMFAVTRIVERNGRKIWPWAWWAMTEFLWLWAYPNAVLEISALNICLAILLWRQYANQQDCWTAMFRLTATNGFAAMCFIQMFLPNLMQARHWAGQEADAHVLDLELVGKTFSCLLSGAEQLYPPVASMTWPVANPMAWGFAFWLLFIALCAKQIRADGKMHGTVRIILLSLLASSVVFAAATWAFHSYFYPRFAITLLPVCLALLALLIDRSRWRVLAWGITFLGFFYSASFQMINLQTHPIEPLREVAGFANKDAALVACYGHGGEVMPVYLPSILQVQNRAALESLMQRAKREARGLVVIYGHSGFNRAMNADGFALLDDREFFEEVKIFSGIEPEFQYRVLRMK